MQVGAVFGMIFAIIVLGVVLFFGTEQITNIMCMGSITQTSKTVKSLESVVDDIQASGEGSSKAFKMSISGNSKVCFIDPADPSASITGKWLPDQNMYPIIEKKIQLNNYNVWIEYDCGTTEPGYKMDHIVLKEPGITSNRNFCVQSGEHVSLTNIGIDVLIEKYTP